MGGNHPVNAVHRAVGAVMYVGIVITLSGSGNDLFIPLAKQQMEADIKRLLRLYNWRKYIIVTYDEVIRKEG